jgi:hypothetical protein
MAADGVQQFGDIALGSTVYGNAAGVGGWKLSGKITLEMMEWWENQHGETLLSAPSRFTRHSPNRKTEEGGLLGKCRGCDGRFGENFGSGRECRHTHCIKAKNFHRRRSAEGEISQSVKVSGIWSKVTSK